MNQSEFFILTILLICIGCQSKGQMNEAKFTKTYAKVLKQKYPDVKYKVTGDLKMKRKKMVKQLHIF